MQGGSGNWVSLWVGTGCRTGLKDWMHLFPLTLTQTSISLETLVTLYLASDRWGQ